ncbi:nucleoside phosphatase GDA1/CD39 [Protomyces lactucae-debilis]|uniref:guanosine-diphosphatase n=1 Tax=Protomyces lactucae-debilis TaxID=2754530 RepID=A0A1Y2FXI6_PROLT|nr:nucleoside phosphatase GDA1/CD39 [Protomyces lactucae-debilis]ORY88004.1 nucleoside phosphatase GDA1/CD39 [Protomyces lactucae-debilis]
MQARSKSRLYKIAGAILFLLTAAYFFFGRSRTGQLDTAMCKAPFDSGKPLTQYVLMVDAGSTGSRIHVYKFNNCQEVPVLEHEAFKMINPGLSSFKEDAQGAAHSLDPLLDLALASVPKHLQSCSPIAVKATAGLRLLGAEMSDKILDAVKAHLEDYPFPVIQDGVGIMDGKDEGVYAWITTNYLLGNIGSADKTPTAAVFDLGGGSTQIVFEPEADVVDMHEGDHKYKLQYGGREFLLYQHSHLGYGLMEARKAIHQEVQKTGGVHPCFAPGTTMEVQLAGKVTFTGAASNGAAQCRFLAEKILNKQGLCNLAPCSFNGIYQPALASFKGEAFVFSYFHDRLKPLGVPSSFTVGDVMALTEQVCAGKDGWQQFSAIDGALAALEEEPNYCLDLSFMVSLLHHGYEMPVDRRLRTAKKIKDNELGWCLGASLPLLDAGTGGWSCRVTEIH